MPDYAVLDATIERYVDHDQGIAEIVAAGFDTDLVQRVGRMLDRAEAAPVSAGFEDQFQGLRTRPASPDHNRWTETVSPDTP